MTIHTGGAFICACSFEKFVSNNARDEASAVVGIRVAPSSDLSCYTSAGNTGLFDGASRRVWTGLFPERAYTYDSAYEQRLNPGDVRHFPSSFPLPVFPTR
jgi:hypothetical protein